MVVAGYPLLDKLVASAVKFSKKLCILNKVKLLIADNELACQFRNDQVENTFALTVEPLAIF